MWKPVFGSLLAATVLNICLGQIPAYALQQQPGKPLVKPGNPEATKSAIRKGNDTIGASPNCSLPAVLPAVAAIRSAAVKALRERNLLFPIAGIDPETIKGSFYSKRGCTLHEAADILSPTGTPVLAVEDGTIAKLFLSKAGGITVYEYDPTRHYVYYYAHLQKYAPGLKEGDPVSRGAVIAYVDTTGNAPKNTPHLHFAITVLGKGDGWWQGTAVDPYEVFRK